MPGSWVASCDIAGVASAVARIAAAPSSVSFVIARSPSRYESERARSDAGSRDRLHGAVSFRDDCLSVAGKRKAGGRYATGLLLQLPARKVRFRCDSMPKVLPLQHY